MKIINAIDLQDLWFQAIYDILEEGERKTVDYGSYAGQERVEYPFFMATIEQPWSEPLLPTIPPNLGIPDPVSSEYLDRYISYLMLPDTAGAEEYTYGERIFDQIPEVIRRYQGYGHTNNQLVLRVGQPSDINMESPPCLQLIDTKISNGRLEFFVYFRSWELWAGLPVNLAGIEILKQYMAEEIGVKNGRMIVASKGLHIYGYAEEIVKLRTGRAL